MFSFSSDSDFTGSAGYKYLENGINTGSSVYAVSYDGRSVRGGELEISSPSFDQHLFKFTFAELVTFLVSLGLKL